MHCTQTKEENISNQVWTTTIMFDENYRVFELTFPGLFDFPAFCKLNKVNATTEQKEEPEIEQGPSENEEVQFDLFV